MPHVSLRPHVETVADLYALLQRDQTNLKRSLSWRCWSLLGVLVVACAAIGPVSQAAICLSVLLAMNWTWGLVELICRNWFMHAMTLHEVIRPPSDSAENVVSRWLDCLKED